MPPQPNTLQQNLLKVVLTIAKIGAHPADSEDVRIQKAIQINAVILGGIPVQAILAILMFSVGETPSGIITAGFAFASTLGVLFLAWKPQNYAFFKFTQVAVPLLSPFAVTLLLGGMFNSAFSIMWGMVTPLFALVLYPPRQALYWFLGFLATVGISGFAQPFLRPTNLIPPEMLTAMAVINIIGIGSMVFASLAYFVSQRELAYRLLNIERDKAENLLLNILPKEIAAILKDESRTIADHYDGASVLFADMVGFTPLSEKLGPVEMVELLNEAFSYFDSLLDKYGVEKIRTIGDNYMVASGVPRSRPDHAQALVHMALDMRDFIATHTFSCGQRVAFRFGINSGPMIGGVIGSRKFVYDVWGDAVNVASRMESHGASGVIQVTEATYQQIKNDFVCEPRGVVNVKGKGEMKVWHVLRTNTSEDLKSKVQAI